MSVCTAPGKIMLAGEYAVIDGSDAIMLAVNRYAVATLHKTPQHLSPFLRAAVDVIIGEYGTSSVQARDAARVRVDTEAFREGGTKLGLGSSAAATVAAIGLALGEGFDTDTVHALARRAHGDAQEPKGARGSGADVASCTYGGCLRFAPAPKTTQVALPDDLHLVFPWCGQSASTTSLVSQVRPLQQHNPDQYRSLTLGISDAAERLVTAGTAAEAIEAVSLAGRAVEALGAAAKAPIWLPVHSQMRDIAKRLGGSVKPTGAGGGDLALGAFHSLEQAQRFRDALVDRGIPCPDLAPSKLGVRLRSQASKVSE